MKLAIGSIVSGRDLLSYLLDMTQNRADVNKVHKALKLSILYVTDVSGANGHSVAKEYRPKKCALRGGLVEAVAIAIVKVQSSAAEGYLLLAEYFEIQTW
ncbi:hypothetical protein T4B_14635 [Trichinella pseudospiralis]|uniref:Uncharacterized protein n=2 Tax=Trichinella pseudospiralis TaxID=6337 RepID=A0A0V1HUZ2_TRIPS|nr:hypothetical protein T4D_1885 [Trichinella pseudospiralis]KRZ13922.1 hypothetical protein T4B_14635 [Trichinella pseudospiralis]